MATKEQRAASGGVMEAVKALNRALSEANRVDLYVELQDVRSVGRRCPTYIVSVIETREMVLPENSVRSL